MKQATNMILMFALMGLLGTGCGEKDAIYLEKDVSEVVVSEQELETEACEVVEEPVIEATEAAGDVCYVYICGAVVNAGVYQLPVGSRVCDAIFLAGGMTEDASAISINQAEQIYDGQMIFIPTIEEAEAGIGGDLLMQGVMNSGGGTGEADARVNINTASAEQLMTLSGIGQAKADDIIAYREAYGNFASVDEIMKVDGIKEGLYNRIKGDIRVK